jgi:hypothetical protein
MHAKRANRNPRPTPWHFVLNSTLPSNKVDK